MNNKFAFAIAISLLLLTVLGCSSLNPLSSNTPASQAPSPQATQAKSEKSLGDKAIDTAVGDDKIGVPECDEVMDMLTAEANNPDDGYIVRAGKAIVFNKIKQSIRDSVQTNKNDIAELTKTCREAKAQLAKAKAEQNSNSGK